MHYKYHQAGYATGCGPAFKRHGHYGHHRQHRGPWGGGFYRRPKHNVPLNIIENDTNYEVHLYALGFSKENIKISVTGDVLNIKGTRTIADDYKPNFTRQEYPIKTFERMLDLNGQVDTNNIEAKQENGVLIITLPKTKEAQKEEQEIKVN
jgi:HSP20 family protein